MTTMKIRDVFLHVEVAGDGPPLVLMHGGPGLDHVSLTPFRQLADRHTVVLYDHRCNGRSTGAPVTSMTWENLTADADALRERLGFKQWAVLGHSFGGQVALEYVLRYPDRVSQLVLLDTAGDSRWSENAADVLAGRGFPSKTVAVARRFYTGRIAPKEFARASLRLLPAYESRFSLLGWARELLVGGWRMKMRPEALIFGGQMMRGWSVMDRLGEIHAPTVVIAGRDDFLFPPESQALLAAGIPGAELRIIERAGHNPQSERPAETLSAVARFLGAPDRDGPAGRTVKGSTTRTYIRPGFLITRVANPIVSRLGGMPALIVRGRRSGRMLTVPMGEPLAFEGRRYLVSGRGETNWVRNLRAAGVGAFRTHGARRPFRATEVAGVEHDRVIAAYRRKLGHSVDPYFREIPDPAGHAVFRIDPLSDAEAFEPIEARR